MMHPSRRGTTSSRALVDTTIAEHSDGLLRLARRHSLCADDAQDAYQRAIEIFLRRADTVEPATAVSWLRTVVKHEAIGVRRSRLQVVGPDEVDLDLSEASSDPGPDEQVLGAELTAHSSEALQRLKPHEVRALWLKAQGHSYAEIGEICGWTHTKVNRCIAEGRRAFLDRYAGIESGAECERWAHVLSAMADGEATADQLADARPHLRNCPACRATLRDFHDVPREVTALVPAIAVVSSTSALRAAWDSLREAMLSLFSRGASGAEVSGAAALGGGGTMAAGGAKVVALCASVSLAAGGTYCLEQTRVLSAGDSRPPTTQVTAAGASPIIAKVPDERRIDREARRSTLVDLAAATTTRDEATTTRRTRVAARRDRREVDETVRASSPSANTSGSSDSQPDFSFESGTASATGTPASAQPPSDPAPPAAPPPSGEFDGGGFE